MKTPVAPKTPELFTAAAWKHLGRVAESTATDGIFFSCEICGENFELSRLDRSRDERFWRQQINRHLAGHLSPFTIATGFRADFYLCPSEPTSVVFMCASCGETFTFNLFDLHTARQVLEKHAIITCGRFAAENSRNSLDSYVYKFWSLGSDDTTGAPVLRRINQ